MACSQLQTINIPSSVTTIGAKAFYGCAKLTSITVDASNANYSSGDGVLFNKAKTSLISCPTGISTTSYTIPSTVTSIAAYAFYGCTKLTSITLPSSVTFIGDYAFYDWSTPPTVYLPKKTGSETVAALGNYAFSTSSNLKFYVADGTGTSSNLTKYTGTTGWSTYAKTTNTFFYCPKTVTAAKIATLYLPYDVKIPTDAKAYYCSSKETGKIKLTELTNVIPANTPVIVTSSGAADFNFQSNGETTDAPTGMNGVLKGAASDITSNVANNYLTLGMKSGTDASPVYGFYTFTGDKIAANTCYMDLPTSTGSAKGFTLSFDGGTTAIDAITDQTAADVNGAMKVFYDLQGRRVQNPTKGIYIVNGKKIVINQ